jgi:hypothetical protein
MNLCVDRLKKFCFSTEKNTCASVVAKRYLATFHHGQHADWLTLGRELLVWPVDMVRSTCRVSVVYVNTTSDLVLLESTEVLCDDEIELSDPHQGDEYLQLSLSANVVHCPKFFVNRGIVGSLQLSPELHILGSPGTCPGDSGGGCFRTGSDSASAKIIAIIAGNKAQEISIRSRLADLSYPSQAVLIPAFVIKNALQVNGNIVSNSA